MNWWKKALIQNLIWVGFLVVFSLIVGWFMSTVPVMPGTPDMGARMEKLGNIVGFMLLGGSVLIWIQASRKKDS